MKHPSDDLFVLIRSLNRNEKGYFRKYAAGESNNYMRLFDAIDSQEKYDEGKIRRKFAGEVFTKQLSFTKQYLYDLILKSLRAYHSNASIDSTLRQWMLDISILYDRGLYPQCRKAIRKARQLAEKHQRQLFIVELVHWEMELIRARNYTGSSDEDFKELYETSCRNLEQFRNITEYEYHSLRMFNNVNKKGFARTDDDIKGYSEIVSQPVFRDPNKALSYQARYNYYTVHLTYHFMTDEPQHAYTYALETVKLAEENVYRVKEKPKELANALNNLIVCQRSLKKYGEMLETIPRLRNMATRSGGLSSRIIHSCNIYELLVYIETGEFEKGIVFCKAFEADYAPGNKLMFAKYSTELYFYVAYTYFGAGKFQEANKLLNNILNARDLELRRDIQALARIMSLIIHYELGNQDLIEYSVRSTYRYLYKAQQLHSFEKAILHFIRSKMPAGNDRKEMARAFGELKAELLEVLRDPYERKALEIFDLISWLESKIEGKAFAEVVKRKSKR